MATMLSWQIANLERDGQWTKPPWSAAISKLAPDAFEIETLPDCLELSCAGAQYCGQLAKCVSPLMCQASNILFSYSVAFGEDIAYGQVLETDSKFTDAAGWTYDGSFQFNVAAGWMTQINNPWVNTGVKVPLTVDIWNRVTVQYALDYVKHTISVNGSAPTAAKQLGWTPNQIVTQLQLCTSQIGAYSARFQGVGYNGQ